MHNCNCVGMVRGLVCGVTDTNIITERSIESHPNKVTTETYTTPLPVGSQRSYKSGLQVAWTREYLSVEASKPK